MAFKRIVANSEEDLEKIVNHVKDWFKNSNYTTEEGTEKRKFQDPDTKEILEKDISIIKVQEPLKDKNGKIIDNKKSTIKFIPMIEKGQMKVEISGEGETVIASKIKDQVEMSRTRDNSTAAPLGKLKSYSKDKKVALKENPKTPTGQELEDEWEKRKANIMKSLKGQVSGNKIKEEEAPKPKMIDKIKNVFEKYKNRKIKLDYESGSEFANFIDDLENTRLFKGSEDALSNFTSSKIFKELTNEKNYNIKFEKPKDDSRKLKLAPEKPSNPSDSIPKQTRDMATRPGATPGATSYSDFDLYELLKKTGKLTVTQLKEIIKKEYYK
jgi:hypothetical protein